MSEKKSKKKKIIKAVIIALCIVVLIISALSTYVFHKIDKLMRGEELTCSYDGKYGYVELSSPENWICTLNLYDTEPMRSYKQTLHEFYKQWEMDDISWGTQSYDLFFDNSEIGRYVYAFLPSGQWLGPLYFDGDATAEKRLAGDMDAYCFYVGIDAKDEAAPEYGYGDIIDIDKDTIPKSFLKKLDLYIK